MWFIFRQGVVHRGPGVRHEMNSLGWACVILDSAGGYRIVEV